MTSTLTLSTSSLVKSKTLRYSITAMSIPIVYTGDGDHDRNGLIYTLSAYKPLIEWARARWYDNHEELPQVHTRSQRIQVLLDGLDRYERRLLRRRRCPVTPGIHHLYPR